MDKTLVKIFLMVILAANMSGCAYYFNEKSATEKRVDIIIASNLNKYENREIIFERLSIEFPEYKEELISLLPEEENGVRIGKDGSEITVLNDGHGTITRIRSFGDNEFIKLMVVKTFPDGFQEAFIYAQNGEIKRLPDNLIAKYASLSDKEIARIVGINEGRRENEFLANLKQKPNPETAENKPQTEPKTEVPVKLPAEEVKSSVVIKMEPLTPETQEHSQQQ